MKFVLIAITVVSLIALSACNNAFSETDAINLTLSKVHELNEPHLNVEFPKRNRTKKLKVPMGGPPGSKTNLELTTKVAMIDKYTYEVKLIKDWNVKVNDVVVLSFWKFRVAPSKIILLEKDDKDDIMGIIG